MGRSLRSALPENTRNQPHLLGALTATGMTLFYTAASHIGLSLAGVIIGLPLSATAILFIGSS